MKAIPVVLLCAFSLHAQITTTLNRLSDGSTEIRMRNDSELALVAFAISVKYESSSHRDPLLLMRDSALAKFPATGIRRSGPDPLPPHQEFTAPADFVVNGKTDRAISEPPLSAGIFSDGTTTGDTGLLMRLMLRRSNMLLAVETTLEALSDAGRKNVPRDQLIAQFTKLADSLQRPYLLSEQQAGLALYQSIVGDLKNLPIGGLGSPFPPDAFVEEETSMLRQQRLALLASEPSLVEVALVGR